MSTYAWKDDYKRQGYCWDYANEKDVPYGYVMYFPQDGTYIARTSSSDHKGEYSTMDEAKAVVEALIAMSN